MQDAVVAPVGKGTVSLAGSQESRRQHYVVMEDQIDELSSRLRAAEGVIEHSKQELAGAREREQQTNSKAKPLLHARTRHSMC